MVSWHSDSELSYVNQCSSKEIMKVQHSTLPFFVHHFTTQSAMYFIYFTPLVLLLLSYSWQQFQTTATLCYA